MGTELATARPENGNAQTPKREIIRVEDDGLMSNVLDTARFEHLYRVANMMAAAKLVPAHLQGSPSDCFLVIAQAIRWGFDPFSVAQKTFVVKQRLGYEGQLVAAVINSRAGLDGRLTYEYSGKDNDRTVKVSGKFTDEAKCREIEATVAEGTMLSPDKTKWSQIPDQMLAYYGARKWARRHAPEILMGVYTPEELSAGIVETRHPATVTVDQLSQLPTIDPEDVSQDPAISPEDESQDTPLLETEVSQKQATAPPDEAQNPNAYDEFQARAKSGPPKGPACVTEWAVIKMFQKTNPTELAAAQDEAGYGMKSLDDCSAIQLGEIIAKVREKSPSPAPRTQKPLMK